MLPSVVTPRCGLPPMPVLPSVAEVAPPTPTGPWGMGTCSAWGCPVDELEVPKVSLFAVTDSVDFATRAGGFCMMGPVVPTPPLPTGVTGSSKGSVGSGGGSGGGRSPLQAARTSAVIQGAHFIVVLQSHSGSG